MSDRVDQFLAAAPIAKWLGMATRADDRGRVFELAFHERHIGNPAIRAIHGGVIEAFLELAAQSALIEETPPGAKADMVNIDIDYLRSSRAEDMYARAAVTRLGRRIAFVEAVGWQGNEDRPVARARFRLRLQPE